MIRLYSVLYNFLEQRNERRAGQAAYSLTRQQFGYFILMNLLCVIYLIVAPFAILFGGKDTQIPIAKTPAVILFVAVFLGITALILYRVKQQRHKYPVNIDLREDVKKVRRYMVFSWLSLFLIPLLIALTGWAMK